jgi:Ca2+-transporting ATPase
MVITDDDFSTIVAAVREGRALYRNIQKFIFFLLSVNAGLAVAVLGGALLGWPALTPLMILWINLVTNGLPALALGVDPTTDEPMHEAPRPPESELLGRRDWLGVAFVGAVMGGLALLVQARAGLTMAFTFLALAPLFHAWSCRSPRASILEARPLVSLPLLGAMLLSAAIQVIAIEIPRLRPIFGTDDLAPNNWLRVVVLALLMIPAVEAAKLVSRFRSTSRPMTAARASSCASR